MKAQKFPLPVYLNQKYVFDILAMIEDGFSQLRSIKTSENKQADSQYKATAGLGLSNVFGLLGVNFSGEKAASEKQGTLSESQTDRVHTPDSLFNRMRSYLIDNEFVRREDLELCSAGDFVEFESKLQLRSLVDVFDSYLSVFRMAMGFDDGEQKDKSKKLENSKHRALMISMENMAKQFRGERNNIDLIGEVNNSLGQPITIVITLDKNFLAENSMSDMVDGSFKILGKVTRNIGPGSQETINLMRNTSLSKMNPEFFDSFMSGFAGLPTVGFKEERIITEVNSPAIQIIPLAIFV